MEYLRPIFISEYKSLTKENSQKTKGIITFIDTIFTDNNLLDKEIVLIYGFHKYLNDEKYSIKQLKNEIALMAKNREIEQNIISKRENRELVERININNNNWFVNDTINLVFNVSEENSHRYVIFNYDPSFNKHNDNSDNLFVKALIKKKYSGTEFNSDLNYKNLMFLLEVIDLSDSITFYGSQKLLVGSEFNLNLEAYGILIE